MAGLFGDLFDFNHDGKLDAFEEATEFGTLATMMDKMDEEESEEEMESELEAAGLDATELEFMDAEERREDLKMRDLILMSLIFREVEIST